jgi:hypothetical protein
MFKILLLQGANGNYQHAHEKGYSLEIFSTNIEGEAIKQRANEHQRVTGMGSCSAGLASDYRSNMRRRR